MSTMGTPGTTGAPGTTSGTGTAATAATSVAGGSGAAPVPVRLAVVSAGLSEPSSTRMLADRLAAATGTALGERGMTVETSTLELRDVAGDIANNFVAGFPSTKLREAIETVATADGLIAVTPVFTASYSGLFKSFFDVLDNDQLVGKPVLFGATGGTPRHSLVLEHAMRPLFAYLRTVTSPTAVYASTDDWGTADDGLTPSLPGRIARAGAEFATLLTPGRFAPTTTEPDPSREEDVIPFEQQLAALRVQD